MYANLDISSKIIKLVQCVNQVAPCVTKLNAWNVPMVSKSIHPTISVFHATVNLMDAHYVNKINVLNVWHSILKLLILEKMFANCAETNMKVAKCVMKLIVMFVRLGIVWFLRHCHKLASCVTWVKDAPLVIPHIVWGVSRGISMLRIMELVIFAKGIV